MTTKEIPLQMHMLRSFKGAPVSVLMALWLIGTPQNVKWLQRQTGYRFEAIQEALDVLNEYQMVQRIDRYHWQIAGNTGQFPLGKAMLSAGDDDESTGPKYIETNLPLFESIQPDEKDFGKTEVQAPEMAENTGTSEKPKSDFGKTEVPVSSSSRSINLDSKKEELLLARDDSGKTEVVETLDRFGVREPKRSRIAGMPGITGRDVLYHLTTAKTVALAIYRIEHRWRVLEGWQPEASPVIEVDDPGMDTADLLPADQVEAFGRALECLRANIPPGIYETWATGLRLAAPVASAPSTPSTPGKAPGAGSSGSGRVVTIGAANSQTIREMEPYADNLRRLLCSEFGLNDLSIKFMVM